MIVIAVIVCVIIVICACIVEMYYPLALRLFEVQR